MESASVQQNGTIRVEATLQERLTSLQDSETVRQARGTMRTLSTSVATDVTSAWAVPPVEATWTLAWASALAVAVCRPTLKSVQLLLWVVIAVGVQKSRLDGVHKRLSSECSTHLKS